VSRLEKLFRDSNRPLLMPYAVGGYPDKESCRSILDCYASNGADVIELGIPFSDPLADGPVIQAATQTALRRGIRPHDVLDLAEEAAGTGRAIVLLAYLNTVLAYGSERFFDECCSRRILGVVIPDLPVEEAVGLQHQARARHVDLILLAAPTSTDERLARIAAAASGFIYCVSSTGVTGVRAAIRSDLSGFLSRIRRHTDLPLAVGFGVATTEQVAEVAQYADGVIIGSALVRMVQPDGDRDSEIRRLAEYLGKVAVTVRATAR